MEGFFVAVSERLSLILKLELHAPEYAEIL